jgi:hypothetical protein
MVKQVLSNLERGAPLDRAGGQSNGMVVRFAGSLALYDNEEVSVRVGIRVRVTSLLNLNPNPNPNPDPNRSLLTSTLTLTETLTQIGAC